VVAREADRALYDEQYDGMYYARGVRTEPTVGTAEYTRLSTHADPGAYLIWRWFAVERTLDVGCAFGFVVEALREMGLDAEGVDVSQYALDHCAAGARGHVRYGNLAHRLPFKRGVFELVSAFETLEHLPPDMVPKVLEELRRVTSKYVIATIPSFGANEHGPGGWFESKVRPDRVDAYYELGPGYRGPVPFDDLARDARGEPIEGHLTVASFDWWTERFSEAGFVRCGAVERRIHPHLARFGLTKYWNLFVFRVPGAPEPDDDVHDLASIEAVERRHGLVDLTADADDVARVKDALGDDAFRGVPLNAG
jgi:SAM-dependent methyltransferase